MSTVGSRLKKSRKNRGLTQKEVYEKIGITDKSLSRYENNISDPDNDSLRSLCELYGVSSDYIIGNKKEAANTSSDSKLDIVVKRIEEDLNVSISDDPMIMEALENYIVTLGNIKKKNQSN